MTTAENIYDYINTIAPFETQEKWDNAGFLVGNLHKAVRKALVCLDVTKAAAEFAARIGADLIISHHPIIFKPISRLLNDSAVYICVENNIAVISAHTNYDIAADGINKKLAEIIGLKNIRQVDNSFIVTGELDGEMSIDDFAVYVSDILDCHGLRYTDTEKPVRTVAVGGGACAEYIDIAIKNADCFLTGEMKYHEILDCAESGFAVISAGHFETEYKPFMAVAEKLKNKFRDVEFICFNQKNPIEAV